MTSTLSHEFAEFLARSGAVRTGDFVLKSGKRSNIFFNFGDVAGGEQLSRLGSFYARAIVDEFRLRPDVIFGPAYKGIPIAVATSIALWRDFGVDVPVAYNRKDSKSHGEKGVLVGADLATRERVVVVDDVITDGLTKLETIALLRTYPSIQQVTFLVGLDRQDVGDDGTTLLKQFEERTGLVVHAITTRSDVLSNANVQLRAVDP